MAIDDEDRQKLHDLQAALVESLGASTVQEVLNAFRAEYMWRTEFRSRGLASWEDQVHDKYNTADGESFQLMEDALIEKGWQDIHEELLENPLDGLESPPGKLVLLTERGEWLTLDRIGLDFRRGHWQACAMVGDSGLMATDEALPLAVLTVVDDQLRRGALKPGPSGASR